MHFFKTFWFKQGQNKQKINGRFPVFETAQNYPPAFFSAKVRQRCTFYFFYIYNICERKKERKGKGSACCFKKMHLPCTIAEKDALSEIKMHYLPPVRVHLFMESALQVRAKVHF